MSEPETPALAPELPAGPAGEVSEDEAWSAVLAAWGDETMHQRYLARFQDVEALAVAGGRYRAILAERPGDTVAVRMRAEVLKKATAYGLARLARTPPPQASAARRRLRLFAALVFGALAVGCVYKLLMFLGARS